MAVRLKYHVLVWEDHDGHRPQGRRRGQALAPRGTGHLQSERANLLLVARIVVGMQYLGQWEERCEEVIEELDRIAGVLCVERMGGSEPASSIAMFFAPYLERGELRMVGEATPVVSPFPAVGGASPT